MKKILLITALLLIFIFTAGLSGCYGDIFNPVVSNDGISSALINDNGELVLTYTSGKQENLGKVVGADGKDGKDGLDGDAVDAKDGITPHIGENGNWWIGENDTGISAEGKDGEKGDKGDKGDTGGDTVYVQTGESDITAAAAKGLLSAVTIRCTHTNASTSADYGASGSGVVYKIDKDNDTAFIITNHHVVYSKNASTENKISDRISIYFYGAEYSDFAIPAEYVGGSMNYDIAILKVNSSALPDYAKEAEIFDSDILKVGMDVVAIGNADAMGTSVTKGTLSVDSETVQMKGADGVNLFDRRFMRIDAAVNPGNSGGGLFDKEGRLIGIVSAKVIETDIDNMGYAIPSNLAVAVAENIIRNCSNKENEAVLRPAIGVSVQVTDSKAVFDNDTGLATIVQKIVVAEVSENSPADGKLKVNDIVLNLEINGKSIDVTRLYHLELLLYGNVGDTAEFTVLRGEDEIKISILLTENITEL